MGSVVFGRTSRPAVTRAQSHIPHFHTSTIALSFASVHRRFDNCDMSKWLLRLTTPFDGPPNGGWGWVVTAASFAIHIVVLGLAYSFGILFRALLADADLPGSDDRAAVSLIGSISVSVMLAMGVLTGSLVHTYGPRPVSLVGGVVVAAGLIASSYAPSVAALYGSYGALLGVGYSLAFAPAVMVVNRYFTSKRSLAVGIAVAGSGAGTFLFSTVNQALIESLGWRGALRADGALAVVLVTISAVMFVPVRIAPPAAATGAGSAATSSGGSTVDGSAAVNTSGKSTEGDARALAAAVADGDAVVDMRPIGTGSDNDRSGETISAPVPTGTSSEEPAPGASNTSAAVSAASSPVVGLTRMQVYRSRPFLHVAAAISCYAGGMFVVYTHLAAHVVEGGGLPSSFAAGIVAIIGAGNIVGRILLGRAADALRGSPRGKIRLFGGGMVASGLAVLLLAVPGVGTSQEYLIPFAVIFGFSAGGIVSLSPPLLVDAMGLEALPLALGGTYTVQALPVLLLPPLAGYVRAISGSYASDWAWAGTLMAAAAGCLWGMPARVSDWLPAALAKGEAAEAAAAGAKQPVPAFTGKGDEVATSTSGSAAASTCPELPPAR